MFLTGSHILALVICCTSQKTEPDPKQLETLRTAFTVFEGDVINVYSTRLDGSDCKLIISEKTELGNARPFDALRAVISPDRRQIMYSVAPRNGWAPIYLVNSDGQNKKKILKKAINFHWSPDGKHILYSLYEARITDEGMPFWSKGYDWYFLDLATNVSEPVAISNHKFLNLAYWKGNEIAVFRGSSIGSQWLFEYDLRKKRKNRATEILRNMRQLAEISESKDGERTVASVWPRSVGIEWSCDLFEVTRRYKLGRHFVNSPNYQCQHIFWNFNSEVYYNKSTRSNRRISTLDTSESGYYTLLSVYKYDFRNRKETSVLKSLGKEVYRLQNVLDGKLIIVSNESVPRSPRYILELRDLNGANPTELFRSDKEMWFIGWLQ